MKLTTPLVLAMSVACTMLSTGIAAEPCRIEIVERGSSWPVPLVELKTTHDVRLVSDNAGLIACDLPEVMGRETWFTVQGHGYEVPKDGFGMRGVRLKPEPGKTLRVEVDRKNLARRIGRLTGAGLFAESQKLGADKDWRDSEIFGCDSVLNAKYRGRQFWAWGDTTLPGYPLGVFDTTSATTAIPPLKSFEPPLRLRFDYFAEKNGRLRGVAKMPGSGPTWLSGYLSIPAKDGTPRLVSTYSKIRNHLEEYEIGLCVWNDSSEEFDKIRVIWTKSETSPKAPRTLQGHPVFWKDSQGREWVLFGNPLPKMRCPATFEAWQDSSTWEALTPQAELVSATDGAKVKPHTGAIAWNSFRKRWLTVFVEYFGKPSLLGEVWYAEADAPTGPWGKAVKVLTHENYTFYNPQLHPDFTPEGSPILLFEGTYTAEFANHAIPTPRYNYNQVLYRLDLDDPKLAPAQKL